MRQHQPELDTAEIAVLVVTFETEARARLYVEEFQPPWPVLVDDSRALYREYGMDRGDNWAIFGPRSWSTYAGLLIRGRRIKKPTGDVHQLGGDVLIDPLGIVRFHHVGEGPSDRPSVSKLLDVVRSEAVKKS